MRAKMIAQPELYFDPPSLKITEEFYAKYDGISRLLDANPGILDLAHADLEALAEMEQPGRSRYASDTVLRLCVCQVIEGLSLRETIVRVDTCSALRRFVRVDGGSMMDYSTFCRLRNAVTPESWKKINQLLAEYALAEEAITGDKLQGLAYADDTLYGISNDGVYAIDVSGGTYQNIYSGWGNNIQGLTVIGGMGGGSVPEPTAVISFLLIAGGGIWLQRRAAAKKA